MDKLNKITLPVVILIASLILGAFYYASEVNKQKSIERQQQVKIQQEKQAQSDLELKGSVAKTQAEQALNTCINAAQASHKKLWYKECSLLGKLTSRCVSLHDMLLEDYLKEKNTPKDAVAEYEALMAYVKETNECSCSLPTYAADSINKVLQDDKDECFSRYPQ